MQVCALLSQLHRHKEALAHAQVAISISHFLIKDIHRLIKYYVERMQCQNKNEDDKGLNNIKQKIGNKHVDFLYDPQLSLLAKTAIKLLPIAEELENRLVSEKLSLKESFEELNSDEFSKLEGQNKNPRPSNSKDNFNTVFDKVDMRNLLGYLNQSDWIWSLNIGNIMQISPLTMQDIYTTSSIEYELSRELVLEKICFLAVSYF
jgi:hypothetical protein